MVENDDESRSFSAKYGFLPLSVWDLGWTKSKTLQIFCADTLGEGELYTKYKSSDGTEKTSSSKGLSQFHPDLAKRIIEFWSEPGDKILDPFAGRVRALIARAYNRNYTGYDISPKACSMLNEKLNTQKTLQTNTNITIINDDSANINYDNEFDMVFSCPPYWNVEDYNKLYEENMAGQLSSMSNYKGFLDKLFVIVGKCYTALKPGKFAVFVVNDFRRDGVLIDFHADVIRLFKGSGFKMHDIVIRKVNTMVSMKIDQCVANKFMVKTHEYILVFQKEKL